jgi:acetyl esterase/lipase
MGLWPAVRLLWALGLLGLGLLAVLRVPHGALWKPAVAATEWGHVLALLALVPLLGSWSDTLGRATALTSLLAGLLLCTPTLRALAVSASLSGRFQGAFGSLPPRLSRVGSSVGSPRLVPATYPCADGTLQKLDLYLPSGGGRAPVVVTVHGGSWNSGDRTVLPALNRHLAERGYAVAALEYRLAPPSEGMAALPRSGHRFPAARDDVLAAVEWLKSRADEYGLDPSKIVLHGRSAGGHLALSAAYHAHDPAIRGVIALYPPTDMHWSWNHPGSRWIIDTPGLLRAFLGGTPAEVSSVYDASSPIRFVEPGSPPTLLVHGGRDELVWPEQSQRLAQALAASGVPHLMVELPWATHGLDANPSGPGGRISTELVERFLGLVAPR